MLQRILITIEIDGIMLNADEKTNHMACKPSQDFFLFHSRLLFQATILYS